MNRRNFLKTAAFVPAPVLTLAIASPENIGTDLVRIGHTIIDFKRKHVSCTEDTWLPDWFLSMLEYIDTDPTKELPIEKVADSIFALNIGWTIDNPEHFKGASFSEVITFKFIRLNLVDVLDKLLFYINGTRVYPQASPHKKDVSQVYLTVNQHLFPANTTVRTICATEHAASVFDVTPQKPMHGSAVIPVGVL